MNPKAVIALIPSFVIGFACNMVPALATIFANFSIFIAGIIASVVYAALNWEAIRAGVPDRPAVPLEAGTSV